MPPKRSKRATPKKKLEETRHEELLKPVWSKEATENLFQRFLEHHEKNYGDHEEFIDKNTHEFNLDTDDKKLEMSKRLFDWVASKGVAGKEKHGDNERGFLYAAENPFLDKMAESGQGSCLAFGSFYAQLAKRTGIDANAKVLELHVDEDGDHWESKKIVHALSRINIGGKNIDVDNTDSKEGFNVTHKKVHVLSKDELAGVAHSAKARFLMEGGKLEESLEAHDDALSLWPNHPKIVLNKGHTLREMGRTEEALDHYTEALELNSGLSSAVYSKTNLLHKLERHEEALSQFDTSIGHFDDSSHGMDQKGNLLDAKSEYLTKLGRHHEAEAESSLSSSITLNNLYKEKGGVEKERSRRIELYKSRLEEDLDDADTWEDVGKMLIESRRFSEASEHYGKALKRFPSHPELLHGKGVASYLLGKVAKGEEKETLHKEAQQYFKESDEHVDEHYDNILHEINESSSAWAVKGQALKRAGRMEEAQMCFDEKMRLERKVNQKKANALLAKLGGQLEKDPENHDLLVKKGKLLHGLGRFTEALRHYKDAIEERGLESPELLKGRASTAFVLSHHPDMKGTEIKERLRDIMAEDLDKVQELST